MKKVLVFMTILCLALSLTPVLAKPNNNHGNNNPNKELGPPTYVLNIQGKKSDWSGSPSESERHTMMVPENVTEYLTLSGQTDVKIWITQGPDFHVEDPNIFDDGEAKFIMGPGKYEVFFVALGKPQTDYAILEGWIWNETENAYLMYVGDVRVKHSGKPDWKDGHDIFWVSPAEAATIGVTIGSKMWIFDFLNLLETEYPGGDYLYLWKLVAGCKHIQVRFYYTGA